MSGSRLAFLDGVRVVDLSRVLAGPYAAQVLGEMGADVIKVESPGGDPARGIGPFLGDRSLYFSSLNTDKRGVVLDLTEASGRRGLDVLLAASDIVIQNFRPDAAAKLKVTPEILLADHPHLVVVTISSFASGSGRQDDAAYDLTAQAESGIMSVTGEPGGAPVRAGVAISDIAAGLWSALGAVAAYTRRLRDGKGSHVEVPLLDAALTLLSYVGTSSLGTGEDPGPVGSGHHNIVPYRAFATTDGWVVVAVLGDKFWPALCEAVGLEDLAVRDDLVTNAQRVAERRSIDDAVEVAIARLSTEEAIRRFGEHGLPHAPINSVLQALSTPYVVEQDLVTDVASPEGTYRVVQGPLRFDHRRRPAPGLGEHTVEVFSDLLEAGSPDLASLIGDARS